MRQNDGGPAFPTPESHGDDYEGMSLRDYFAAKAMAAIWQSLDSDLEHGVAVKSCAVMAYRLADAMIAERNG